MWAVLRKETKTVVLKVRLEPSYKREITRFALIHRVDVSDVVRLGVQRVMDGADVKIKPMELLHGG